MGRRGSFQSKSGERLGSRRRTFPDGLSHYLPVTATILWNDEYSIQVFLNVPLGPFFIDPIQAEITHVTRSLSTTASASNRPTRQSSIDNYHEDYLIPCQMSRSKASCPVRRSPS